MANRKPLPKSLLPAERTAAPIDPGNHRGYDALLFGLSALLEDARRGVARAVNAILTATYWEVGRRVVEFEQGGRARAGYGEALLKRIAVDLTAAHDRGFSRQNLQQMRVLFLGWEICQTPSGIFLCAQKGHDEARYALEGLGNKVLTATYRTKLPEANVLIAEIERTRRMLELRSATEGGKPTEAR